MEAEDRRRPAPSTPRTPPPPLPPPSSTSSPVASFLQIPSGWCAAAARGWGVTRTRNPGGPNLLAGTPRGLALDMFVAGKRFAASGTAT